MYRPPIQNGAQARVNIFDIPQVIHLTLCESSVGNPVLSNYPINRTDFRLLRGVPNVIQFFVRDVDRQIVTGPLANATLVCNIVDPNANVVLMQRNLCVVNAATSLYSLSTQPSDMVNWPTGSLQYSILVSRSDGSQGMLWTDRDYSPYGICTVTDGPLPGPATPTVLNPMTFVSIDGYSYSSPLPGAALFGYPDNAQTFSFYTTNFTGNIQIEASLVSQPSSESQNWFNVDTQVFNTSNGVTSATYLGNYLWMRVGVQNTNYTYGTPYTYPLANGVVDQILYLS